MDGQKRTTWEWLVFVSVIALSLALLGATYNYRQRFEKQKILQSQLQLLRSAELLYRVVNKSNPPSLKSLIEGSFTLQDKSISSRSYIDKPPALTNGKLLDPFGNPYSYNPATGWVRSQTRGYEFW